MKKLLSISIQGKQKAWSFLFYGDPKHMQEWWDDDLEIYEIENTIPAWVVDLGLTSIWCFLQDIFNLKSPLK